MRPHLTAPVGIAPIGDPTTSSTFSIIARLSLVRRLLCCAACVWPLTIAGAAQVAPARMVVVLVPGLQNNDIMAPETPTLRTLIAEGGSGWLICRTARPIRHSAALTSEVEAAAQALTLGSGARATAPPELEACLRAPAAQAGTLLPPDVMRRLVAANTRLDHPIQPGWLGSLVHSAGRTVAITADEPGCGLPLDAMLFAMDGAGRTDGPAAALHRVVAAPLAPFGFRADVVSLASDVGRLQANVLTVVRFGDIARARRYAPLCSPAVASANRSRALGGLDALLTALRLRMRTVSPGKLVLLAPPLNEDAPDDRLTPIVVWGAATPVGALYSPSTRRRSLAMNVDILPTLAEWAGLPGPQGAAGRSLSIRGDRLRTSRTLRSVLTSILRTARQQNALGGLPTLQALFVLAGTLAVLLANRRRPAAAAGIAAISLPPGMLLLPALGPRTVMEAGALLAIWTAAWSAMAWLWAEDRHRLVALFQLLASGLTAALVLDLLTGSHLLQGAWMSYSVVEAARFYGIGNEYMGALIGAACVSFAFMAEERRHGAATPQPPALTGAAPTLRGIPLLVSVTAAILIAAIMGAPFLGAKVGAAPAAAAAFGAALLLSTGRKLGVRHALYLAAAVAAMLGLFVVIDLSRAGQQQTHLIRALQGSGGDSLVGIARRKLLLEGELLISSPWSAALFAAALGTGLLRRRRRSVDRQSPRAQSAMVGIGVGAVLAVLCNDSGVTAAALLCIYGWSLTIVELAVEGLDPAPVPNRIPNPVL